MLFPLCRCAQQLGGILHQSADALSLSVFQRDILLDANDPGKGLDIAKFI